jgi:hypothetical protein
LRPKDQLQGIPWLYGDNMAKKIDTVERDGRLVHVDDNGLELDDDTGKIVRPALVNLSLSLD